MSKETRGILTDLLIAVVVLCVSLPFFCAIHAKPNEVVKNDTIYVYDTIRIVEPVPVKEEVIKYVYVTLPKADGNIPISNELDSIGELSNGLSNDSVEAIISITERTYNHSTYKAVVRGYNPELVSLDIYNITKYYPVVETTKIKPKIAISAGVYGGFGNKGADYGLGVMVGVPIWSW